MILIKPCCDSGIHLLPKLIEDNKELTLTFCPWCAKEIIHKLPIEVIAREYTEKAPHPPNNWRVEVEFNLDSRTTAWFVMNCSDCWFDQQEANARAQLIRNLLHEIRW